MIRSKLRTKILATLGPATEDEITIKRMIDDGVHCCRLNFSHGDLDTHKIMLEKVRNAAGELNRQIAVLGDLCGPKIRVDPVPDIDGTGGIPINDGDILSIRQEVDPDNPLCISSNYDKIIYDLAVGDRVLIEDGLLRFKVIEKTNEEVLCKCLSGGVIKSRKGINLPDSEINIPTVTDQDLACVDWAIENRLDFLALSFVRSPDDLRQLRQYMIERDAVIPLIAKIEKPQALEHIDEIIEESDGLMVARGDLGVEMDLAQVPVIQKDLVKRCQYACKPVIVATQMLQSMTDNYTPTRAETTDVANAIFEGADGVMLSGETSVGKHPAVVVRTMAHIAMTAEDYHIKEIRSGQPLPEVHNIPPYSSIAAGVMGMVRDLPITAIVCCHLPETFTRLFSSMHSPVPVFAMAESGVELRRMCITCGAVPIQVELPEPQLELLNTIDELLTRKNFSRTGDRVIVIAERHYDALDVMLHTVIDPHDD